VLTHAGCGKRLVRLCQGEVRYRSLKEEADANRGGGLANELYTKGLADFLNVLDASARSISEDQLVQSEKPSPKLVALYKASAAAGETETRLAKDQPSTR